MKRLVILVFCLLAFPVIASHIVGGEFELKHISGNQYRVNLIIYFDMLNGNPGAKDPAATVAIYRRADNQLMQTLVLSLVSETPVSYTQPECSQGEIKTSRITYSALVNLSDSQYGDPQGYYLTWERCCRNYSITNIYSEDPSTGGGIYAGQAFYLEFPPVVKNGTPFYNSSPRLFPPLNDYACPNKKYYVDFAGVDDDGDSLVYSLVKPLNTRSADALPPGGIPRPMPYPEVIFRAPYGIGNYVGGSPDLNISEDGFLTVTPRLQGLFVFAVKCEEFRNGEKIGELRRDFQMLVVDKCAAAEPPRLLGKKALDPTFVHEGIMSVSFSNTVSDEDRCIQIQVSDADALRVEDGMTENISIRAIPLGFKGDMSAILPGVTTATLVNGSTATFDICFDKCPPVDHGKFQVGIIAYDDACSLPLSDTLRINVTVEPPPNQKPYFTTANVNEVVMEGDPRSYAIKAVDNDAQPLNFFLLANPFFDLAAVGMTFREVSRADGSIEAVLDWDTKCDVYDFTQMQRFNLKVLVADLDQCNFSKLDTMILNLEVDLPGNEDPIIGSDLSPDQIANGIDIEVFERVGFNVFASDNDNDYLELRGNGVDFNFAQYSMNFPPREGPGAVPLKSDFDWDVTCNAVDLTDKSSFNLRFIAVDNKNKCRFYKADTLDVQVNVHPPSNAGPDLTIVNLNPELAFIANEQSVILGQQISLALSATDGDVIPTADEVSIELVSVDGTTVPTDYIFAPVKGIQSANTTFVWNPDCNLFDNRERAGEYNFKFRAVDNRCFNVKADTVDVRFLISDVEQDAAEFLPPNYISPNNDGKNDFFAMVKEDEQTGALINILPKDNCLGRFVSFTMYNRWGNPVFSSGTRDFQWYPKNEPAGIYYYTLKFSDKEYKGSVTIQY